RAFEATQRFYHRTLTWSLAHSGFIAIILAVTVGLNVYLFVIIPKGFFPQQDTGALTGGIRADQSISFQALEKKFTQFISILQEDPAVASVVGFTGGGGATNGGFVFIQLKPLKERKVHADAVIARLRGKLSDVSGARLFLTPVQDIRAGGRQGNGQYQYSIQADDLAQLETWVPRITRALEHVPELADINSDREEKGLDIELKIDRDAVARFGLSLSEVDNTLYDAFGQRQVSTIYSDFNQYHVVMEVAPAFWQSPQSLNDIYVSTGGAASGTQSTALTDFTAAGTDASATPNAGAEAARNQALNQLTNSARGGTSAGAAVSTNARTMVPLSAVSHFEFGQAPLSIGHQGPFVATTFSFNLPEGQSLGKATEAIRRTMDDLHVPVSVHGAFAGTAQVFQKSLSAEPLLVLAAIVAVYIVLGVLYESTVHPITILSTLPSAGVGAVLALLIFRMEFSLIALIGVILLIGIVKKNAIMMIDVALELEREQGFDPLDAIHEAAMRRLRPILMTTTAAMLGAAPLALMSGEGAEMRRPLGISIVGGLMLSQILTLYTTPVVYLFLDRWRLRMHERWERWYGGLFGRKETA
ncbi:MAG: efflux RND transporter permease subunit, partial [Croceibacterium sp.]